MASIQGIYVALFGRPADPLGLAFWNEETGNGSDLSPLIGTLTQEAEYLDRFDGMSNAEIVNSIYQSLFGRDAEPAGLAFFIEELTSGRQTIETIAINILDGAQGDDLETLNAKIAAADLFTTGLDTDAEIDAYAGPDAAQVGIDFLKGIDKDNPADGPLSDEWILKLFPDEGQAPGGGGGVGGGNPPADTTPPLAPVITDVTYEITEDGGSVTVTGSSEANAEVRFFLDGVDTGITFKPTTATWTYTFTYEGEVPAVEGTFEISATAEDAAGNTSGMSNAYPVNFDNKAPDAPVIESVTFEITEDGGSVTVTGSSEANAEVRFFLDGVDTGVIFTPETADWTYTFEYEGEVPAVQGTFNISATATDEAGNLSGMSNASPVNFDNKAPDAPVITEITYEITEEGRIVTVTGSSEIGAEVRLFLDGTDIGVSYTPTTTEWEFTFNSGVAPGTKEIYPITATATDAAGNVSEHSSVFNVDYGPGQGEVWVVGLDGNIALIVDGENPIHDAVQSVEAVDGGTIVIGTGTYEINSTITVNKELTFLGANSGTNPTEHVPGAETILKGVGNLSKGAFNVVAEGGSHTNNVTFDGLHFTGFRALDVKDAGIILLSGSAVNENLTITNSVFSDSNIPGFNTQSGTNGYKITDNLFKDFKSTGYVNLSAVEISTSNSGGSTNGLIDGNVIAEIRGTGLGSSSGQTHGLLLGGGNDATGKQHNITVSNNVIDGTDAAGMRIQHNLDNVVITGNTLRNINEHEKSDDGAIRFNFNKVTGDVYVHGNTIHESFNGVVFTTVPSSGWNLTDQINISDNVFTNISGKYFHNSSGQIFDGTGEINTIDGVEYIAWVGGAAANILGDASATTNLWINGEGGHDTLIGGSGDDIFIGGAGNDKFVFSGAHVGDDIILDFVKGEDQIDLTAYVGASYGDLQRNIVDGNTVITATGTGGSVTVKGVTDLAASDFLFA